MLAQGLKRVGDLASAHLIFLKRALQIGVDGRLGFAVELLLPSKFGSGRRPVALVAIEQRNRDLDGGEGGVYSGHRVWQLGSFVAIDNREVGPCYNGLKTLVCAGFVNRGRGHLDFGPPSQHIVNRRAESGRRRHRVERFGQHDLAESICPISLNSSTRALVASIVARCAAI